MSSTTYNTSKPIAGEIKGTTVPAQIDTYETGMLLERTANVYLPWAGVNPVKAVAWEDATLTAQSPLAVVTTGSEILGSGLKDANGDPATVDQALIENCRDAGIIIR